MKKIFCLISILLVLTACDSSKVNDSSTACNYITATKFIAKEFIEIGAYDVVDSIFQGMKLRGDKVSWAGYTHSNVPICEVKGYDKTSKKEVIIYYTYDKSTDEYKTVVFDEGEYIIMKK